MKTLTCKKNILPMREMKIVLGENHRVEAHYKGLVIQTDQPVKAGGDGSAPAPFDLFLASIGTCAGYYVQQFCKQRQISTDDIHLTQTMHYDSATGMIGEIEINIFLPPDFPEQYKHAVIKAAEACAVKKHVSKAPAFVVNIA
jgi:putative redox protein